MDKHYICTGTGKGVSDELKKCETEGCSKHGEMLEPCDCSDGRHNERQIQDTEGESRAVGEMEDYAK